MVAGKESYVNPMLDKAVDLVADCIDDMGDFECIKAARDVLELCIETCAKIAEDYTRDDQGRAIATRIRELKTWGPLL
jgi:hypothetical protein